MILLAYIAGVHVSTKHDNPWAVNIVTSIIKRAQELKCSSEIFFIDSISSVKTTNSTVTYILTPSKAGAIPLAVIIHEGQSENSYIEIFTFLQNNFPLNFGDHEVKHNNDTYIYFL